MKPAKSLIHLGHDEQLLVNYFQGCVGKSTIDDIENGCGLKSNSIHARMWGLETKGFEFGNSKVKLQTGKFLWYYWMTKTPWSKETQRQSALDIEPASEEKRMECPWCGVDEWYLVADRYMRNVRCSICGYDVDPQEYRRTRKCKDTKKG